MAFIDALKKKLQKGNKSESGREESADSSSKTALREKILAPRCYTHVLTKPHVTEKTTYLKGQNKYAFRIFKNSNKKEVAEAIHEIFHVKPTSIHIVNIKGKTTKFRTIPGKKSSMKKAIVTLPKGKTLSIYEGV